MTNAHSTSCTRRRRSERGAILIQVAVALLGLLALSAFVGSPIQALASFVSFFLELSAQFLKARLHFLG